MNTKLLTKSMAVFGLYAGASLVSLQAAFFPTDPTNDTTGVVPVSITALGVSGKKTENFNSYTASGVKADMPAGFFVETAGTPLFDGLDNGTKTAGRFYSYRNTGTPNERSFGILESSGTSNSDSRVFFKFKNNTGEPITRLKVKYTVKQWRDGARLNRIRLKYNTGTGGFGSIDDLVNTPAPQNLSSPTNPVDGDTVNVVVETEFLLPTALANGSNGYLRWQFSSSGDSGTRDALAIDDFEITAFGSGAPRTWSSGTSSSANWFSANKWNNGTADVNWVNGNFNAVLAGATPTSVTLDGTAELVDVVVSGANYTITPSMSTDKIQLSGVVSVADTRKLTMAAGFSGTDGLIKVGLGELELNGANTFSGTLLVSQGSVKIGSGAMFSQVNNLRVLANTIFDLNGQAKTFGSLLGDGVNSGAAESTAEVKLGEDGQLTLNITGTSSFDYRGKITDPANNEDGRVIKTGTGTQRFRTFPKEYSAPTIIGDGVLIVTENGIMTGTEYIEVTGNGTTTIGELNLVTDESTSQSYTFGGPIILDGGYLASESPGGVVLTNEVQLAPNGDNRIYSRGASNSFTLSGAIVNETTQAGFRKNGQGKIILLGTNTFTGEVNLNNGTIEIPSAGSWGASGGVNASLFFGDGDQLGRKFILGKNVTVDGLEGNVKEAPLGSLPVSPFTPYTAADYALVNIGTNTFTVNQPPLVVQTGFAPDPIVWEETKPSYQGDFVATGAGKLVKSGLGTTRFTRHAKAFTGKVEVNQGVLQISGDGQITGGSADIEVNQGGQLRLSGGGATLPGAIYAFGSRNIKLSSTQRATGGNVQIDRDLGIFGGLRFEPPQGAPSFEKFVRLDSPIEVTGASEIHVAGTTAEATLAGVLSGSSALARSGGGKLTIDANATYSGTMTLKNGVTTIASGRTFGGSIVLASGSAPVLDFPGTATISGAVTVNPNTVVSYRPGSPITVTGAVNMGQGDWVVDLNGLGSSGTSAMFIGGVGTSLDTTGGTFLNVPSGKSASLSRSGTTINLVITP